VLVPYVKIIHQKVKYRGKNSSWEKAFSDIYFYHYRCNVTIGDVCGCSFFVPNAPLFLCLNSLHKQILRSHDIPMYTTLFWSAVSGGTNE